MNNMDNEYKAILQEFEVEEQIERPETKLTGVDADAIPVIIDIGYYTSPRFWGKNSDSDNDTLQFMINMATFEANNISISDKGTIFQRWDITQGNDGYIDDNARRHIRRAICLITDVFENGDYDRTKGSYSFTLPGMSVSQSTSENNLVIPQAAINELIAAGFHLAPYATDVTDDTNKCITDIDTDFYRPGNEELCTPITIAQADTRYVAKYQQDGIFNTIATINDRRMVEFKRLQDIDTTGLQAEFAKKILDPISMIYKQINEFDISYWDGLTKEQIYNAIQAAGTIWKPDIVYRKDFVVMFVDADESGYKFAKSKIDNNIGNNPNTSPDAWEILPADPQEIQAIIDYLINYIDNLPKVQYFSEFVGGLGLFADSSSYQQYNRNAEIDDSWWQDVNIPFAFENEVNTFTQTQKFDRIIEAGQPNGRQAYFLPRNNSGKTPLKVGNSPGNDDKRFDIDLENRSRILNAPTPNSSGEVANKQYVDNAKTSAISESQSYTNNKASDTLSRANSFTTMELNNYYNKTISDSRFARKPTLFKTWNITYANRAGEDQADGGKIRFYKWRLTGISAVKFDALVWNFETFGDERYHTWSVVLDSTNNNQAWLYITSLTPWTSINATLKLYSID